MFPRHMTKMQIGAVCCEMSNQIGSSVINGFFCPFLSTGFLSPSVVYLKCFFSEEECLPRVIHPFPPLQQSPDERILCAARSHPQVSTADKTGAIAFARSRQLFCRDYWRPERKCSGFHSATDDYHLAVHDSDESAMGKSVGLVGRETWV